MCKLCIRSALCTSFSKLYHVIIPRTWLCGMSARGVPFRCKYVSFVYQTSFLCKFFKVLLGRGTRS